MTTYDYTETSLASHAQWTLVQSVSLLQVPPLGLVERTSTYSAQLILLQILYLRMCMFQVLSGSLVQTMPHFPLVWQCLQWQSVATPTPVHCSFLHCKSPMQGCTHVDLEEMQDWQTMQWSLWMVCCNYGILTLLSISPKLLFSSTHHHCTVGY